MTKESTRYISLELDSNNKIIVYLNVIEPYNRKQYERKILCCDVVKTIPDNVKKMIVDNKWTKILFFINFHILSINAGLPKSIKKNKDFFLLFENIIWSNVWEGPQKFGQVNKFSIDANILPMFDYCKIFIATTGIKKLIYLDSDISTEKTFELWNKENPILNLDCRYVGDIWSEVLVNALRHDFKNYNYNLELDWIDYRKKVKFNYDKQIYWCYNRIFRLGKLYAVFNLYKHDLLKYGKVSYYGNTAEKDYGFYAEIFKNLNLIDDKQEFVDFGKLGNIKSDKVNAKNNLATKIDYTLLSCPINICTETNYFEKNLFFNEKALKPILFGQLILPVASSGLFNALSKHYNFKFSDITLEIDSIEDDRQRIEKIIEYLKIFVKDKNKMIFEVEKNFNYFDHNIKIISENSKKYSTLNLLKNILKEVAKN